MMRSLYGHRGTITGLAALSGSMLASCGVDGTVRVWDPTVRLHHHVLPLQDTPVSHITASVGESFATGGSNGTVRFWERDTVMTQAVGTPANHPPVRALAADPHGRWLAVAWPSCASQIWERTDRLEPDDYNYKVRNVLMLSPVVQPLWRERLRLTDTRDEVTTMSASNDGKLLAVACLDGTIRVHATTGDWEPAATLRFHHTSRALAWSASDQYLVAGTDDGAVLCWDRASGTRYRMAQTHGGAVRSVAAATQAPVIATGADDGTVRIWMTDSWASHPGQRQHADAVRALATTPDGRWLASLGLSLTM